MRLFGFEIKRTNDDENLPSFVPKETDDGAVVVAPSGAFGTYVDLDGTIRTEAELVNRYRDMSLHPEVAEAIDAIVNEAFAIEDKEIVEIVLDDVQFPPNVKQAIEAEFSEILRLLNFRRLAYETFRRWYIDGRLYYHVIIDDEMPELGIKELRYIDPRKIRKVREVVRKRLPVPVGSGSSMASMVQTRNEYYVFSDAGFNFSNKNSTQPDGGGVSGLRIAKDSILHVTSGLTDTAGNMVLSYLHKAIKPLNQLRAIEDASVIYRLSRAPERRVWYIDIGNLPKMKAEQYVREIMVKHKNRLTYDASTGEIRDDRKFMTLLEDYWLPRREGGRGTEVSTLPAGQNLGEIEDIEYFLNKLYKSLNVPITRLQSDATFTIGRVTELTRDEITFTRFIERLRHRFSVLFIKALEKQLVLKNIVTIDDWNQIDDLVKFKYNVDNYFAELKQLEILQTRLGALQLIDMYAGKYYSHEWIRRNVLQQSEEDIDMMDQQISMEMENPQYIGMNAYDSAMNTIQGMQGQDGGGGQSPSQSSGGSDEDQDNLNLVNIKATYDNLKKKGANRTEQEDYMFHSAAQLMFHHWREKPKNPKKTRLKLDRIK